MQNSDLIALGNFYAHTKTNRDGSPAPKSEWEPLFTSFCEIDPNAPSAACSGKGANHCPHCENLEQQHGHLNKVAHLAAKFAANMLPEGKDREAVKQWGYLAGLWHDFGKFSVEFQKYLAKVSDIHCDEVLEKIDHTTAGAKLAISVYPIRQKQEKAQVLFIR